MKPILPDASKNHSASTLGSTVSVIKGASNRVSTTIYPKQTDEKHPTIENTNIVLIFFPECKQTSYNNSSREIESEKSGELL